MNESERWGVSVDWPDSWYADTGEFDPKAFVHLGAGLLAPKRFETKLAAGEVLGYRQDGTTEIQRPFDKAQGITKYSIMLEWNNDNGCFFVKSFNMTLDEKWLNGDINGALLRTIRVQDVIGTSTDFSPFFTFRNIEDGKGYADEFNYNDSSFKIDGQYPEEIAAKGPIPDVLLYVARAYLALSALRSKPHKFIESVFEIPPRTASHWIKLSRERGYFDKSSFQECEDFINGAS